MGKVVAPIISWKMLLHGVSMSSVAALSSGGIVYLMLGLESAKEAWIFAFSVAAVLFVGFIIIKLMQKRSARYYYIGVIFFTLHLAIILYSFLVPAFFVIPFFSLLGGFLLIIMIISVAVNVQMVRGHFFGEWKKAHLDITVVIEGVRGISVRKFARTPNLKGIPNIFNFNPRWLSLCINFSALGAMFLGFGFRKLFPELAVFAVGCGAVYVGGYLAQWVAVCFYKIRIVGELEKKYGHPLVAMDFAD
jgi:hypothetical protein